MSESPPAAPAAAPSPEPPNSRLDTILVVGVLVIVGGIVWGLFREDIKVVLPTIASFGSALISAVIAGYAGYRWGASNAMKKLGGGDQ